MGTTSIEWTDASWNPVVGCSKVSPGCAHCYAELMAARLKAMALADIEAGRNPGRKRHYIEAIDDKGRWSGKLVPVPEALDDPQRWKRPRKVFVNSMSDLFHPSVPPSFIFDVFHAMELAPRHTFQILTKRPLRMRDVIGGSSGAGLTVDPLPNVWLGVSCEDQQRADERIPHLVGKGHRSWPAVPAAVHFVSLEPLLGPIDLRPWLARQMIDWVIVGGESGPGARPMAKEWARDLRDQCNDFGAHFFFKQWGAQQEGRLLDLREHNATP